MKLFIDKLIDPAQCSDWVGALRDASFDDGITTAGWLARSAKDNEQLAQGPLFDQISATVQNVIFTNPQIKMHLRPARLAPLRISRYDPGMAYGRHVDDARIGGVRSDISFTVFLNDGFEGGALRLHESDGAEDILLAPGQAVFYPSGALHEVAEVTAGTRFVIVGWIESLMSDPRKREILADIETSRNALFERGDASEEVLQLSKALTNLSRLWQGS